MELHLLQTKKYMGDVNRSNYFYYRDILYTHKQIPAFI